MMKISLSRIVRQSNEQVSTEIDGEAVMLSVEKGKYYGLDEIGTRVWQLIEMPIQVSEIISKLQDEYEDIEKTCEQDVLELLNELQKDELITIADE